MNWLHTLIIAIVEGLTEYLPISSTAHMVFAANLLGVPENDFVKMFQIAIQFGAILAVVVLYYRKFFDLKNLRFYWILLVAVIPALILGKIFDDKIEAVLGNPIPIAVVLVIGGVVLLFVDKYFQNPTVHSEKEISVKQAIAIGFWQCLAMMPGTSRSAASIIGGMQQGLSRQAAAEFSFFLAVPTMTAATCYSVFIKTWGEGVTAQKGYQLITASPEHVQSFIIGNIVAFVVAMLAIKFFIDMIKRFGFKPWGWYRIIAGLALLAYYTLP
ncbi:MAG: undecaprenyl-diphosphate phosphatase [Neisseria sp.]|nr:undecaprenyl-diphosphate phosphatase [Neisseria sp.]